MKFKQIFEQKKLYQNTLASHKYSHQWKEELFSFPYIPLVLLLMY